MTNLISSNEGILNNNLKSYKQINNNNLRHIEINEYYSQRNQAYVDLFKTIIVGVILIIIVAILDKSNIVPKSITSTISIILIFAVVIISIIKIMDISSRDPRNFNHYKVPFDPKAEELEDAGKLDNISDLFKNELGNFGCFDDMCCTAGMKFDKSSKKCILESASELESDVNSKNISKDEADAIKNIVETGHTISNDITYQQLQNAIKKTTKNLADPTHFTTRDLN